MAPKIRGTFKLRNWKTGSFLRHYFDLKTFSFGGFVKDGKIEGVELLLNKVFFFFAFWPPTASHKNHPNQTG